MKPPPMKMSHLLHINLFVYNKVNLWLPYYFWVNSDSTCWVTTFHLNNTTRLPHFYEILFVVAREHGILSSWCAVSPSTAISSVSADPPIYCDTASLLISLIKLADWRQGRRCVQSSQNVINSAHTWMVLWGLHVSRLNRFEQTGISHNAHDDALHSRLGFTTVNQRSVCMCVYIWHWLKS